MHVLNGIGMKNGGIMNGLMAGADMPAVGAALGEAAEALGADDDEDGAAPLPPAPGAAAKTCVDIRLNLIEILTMKSS